METLFLKKLSRFTKLFTIFILLCSIYPAIAFSQGTVVHDSLFSTSLGYYKKVNVYLPQSYNHDSRKYKVIYFLHEANENQSGYTFLYGILDSLIANDIIEPVIVVKPDGSQGPYLGSFYTNSALYGAYEDFIYKDVIGYIDSHYRTKAKRESRCIMGHSMGGYGSMKMALKHPGLFRAVASHSGPLDLYHFGDAFPYLFAESGGAPPYSFAPFHGIFSALLFSAAGAFTPNLSNPPFYVDFPVDVNGNVILSVFVRSIPHNVAHLTANISASTNLAMYFDCGIQDEITLYGWNNGFRDSLVARNIPYTYDTYTGGHSNKLPERFPISLQFLDAAMKDHGKDDNSPISNSISLNFKLDQNYPNPFNPVTKINYSIPLQGLVMLKVYDILGREVKTLVNDVLTSGDYTVEFDGTKVPSGIYFYKLITNSFSDTKKMLLIK